VFIKHFDCLLMMTSFIADAPCLTFFHLYIFIRHRFVSRPLLVSFVSPSDYVDVSTCHTNAFPVGPKPECMKDSDDFAEWGYTVGVSF
jgi:hypothetical protein